MKILFLIIIIILLPKSVLGINVKVKIHHENISFLNNVNVCFWKKTSFIYKDNPSFCIKTNEMGIADVDLPDGEYYIFADKKLDKRYLFGFYGLNPHKTVKDSILNINLIEYPNAFLKKIKGKTITGRVYYKGSPVKDAEILLYLDLTTELKGPPFLHTKTGENGAFHLDLEEGSYYLFVRKKKDHFGPPKSGDLVSFFPEFPIVVEGNKGYDLHIEMMRVSDKISDSFNKLIKVFGTVRDKNNKFLSNVYVVVYDKSEILGKPKYISTMTDKEGNYVIYIKEPGSYFLVVRKNLGDTPDINDVYVYGEIEVKDKDDKKIDIFADFNG